MRKMTVKERTENIVRILKKTYPAVRCTLEYSSPFELLVATELSAQCTDARVNIVTPALFARYGSADDFAAAEEAELSEYIKSAGFYKTKAKNIIKCAERVAEVYGGEVPDNMEDLLTLAGCGRKTANLILGEVFGKEAFIVDTHCIRLTNRMGIVSEKDPKKIEMRLRKLIPAEESLGFCHRLVHHGRNVCKARKPECENCTVKEYCRSYKKATKEM